MKLTDRKRQQIISAAVKEFRNNGFLGTSMDAVAQRAEVSKRTVYNHFSSKDALFLGIVEYMFGLMSETAPQAYSPTEDIKTQLCRIAQQKVELFSSEEFLDLSRVTIPEAIHCPEKLQQAMCQMAQIESRMEKWFADAIEDGKLKFKTPCEACQQFMGLLKMEAFWPRLLKDAGSPNEEQKQGMITKVVGMFLCYFGVDCE